MFNLDALDLGKWAPYISFDHTRWYSLPETLDRDLENYQPGGNELEAMPKYLFKQRLRRALLRADQSVRLFPVSYHGPRHFREILSDIMDVFTTYERLTGVKFPEAVVQAKAFEAALHDFWHQGSTFRADAPAGKPLPELGVDVTTEQVSVVLADPLLIEFGLNPLARLYIATGIWATTFGAKTKRGKELGLERIVPTTFSEVAIVASDVAPRGYFINRVLNAESVQFEEVAAIPAPTSWDGWIASQEAFYNFYVRKVMDDLNRVAGVNLTHPLGWEAVFEAHLQRLQDIKAGRDDIREVICKSILPEDLIGCNS